MENFQLLFFGFAHLFLPDNKFKLSEMFQRSGMSPDLSLVYKQALRHASKRAGKQLIPSSRSKTLDATPTERKLKPFAFGNFSALLNPEKGQIEKSRSAIEQIDSFESLRIFPTVRSAMVREIKEKYNLKSTYIDDKEQLDIKPSPVQVAAIKKINQPRKQRQKKKEGQSIVSTLIEENEKSRLKVFTIAAETGSGKTWAYLASVFSKLKEEDKALFDYGEQYLAEAQKEETIRSVVLLPTHELVDQVHSTAHRAAHMPLDIEADVSEKIRRSAEFSSYLARPQSQKSLGLRVVKWSSGDSHQKLFKIAKEGRIDMLVTTPSKLQSLTKLDNVPRPLRFLSGVEYCVIDEADTLMDKLWINDTRGALQRFPKLKDLIMCSATIPKDFNKTIGEMFKDESSVIRIVTPQIHKIPKQINVKIIDAQLPPYNGSKTRCLAQALFAIYNDGTEQGHLKRVIIFVNEKKDVEPLVETLCAKYGHRESDIIGVTGGDSAEVRATKIAPFVNPAIPLEEDPDGSKIKVLVTTDLLARGLNFSGIKNVILMDLPRNSVDLIHRVGRTGRMKQSGRVFVIIDKKTRKSWIKGLPKAIKRGVTIG